MILRSVLLLATFGVQWLGAAAIVDVSGDSALLFRTGDTLAFEVRPGSFEKNAQTFGLPIYPTEISFALVSGPLSGAGDFSASLRPSDGGASVDFARLLEYHDGLFAAGGVRRAVSTLQGYLQLSPELSQEVFRSGTAVLRLRNDGPDVMIGLDPYTMRQDLFVSLAGGPLTVGGIVDSVMLESGGGFREAPSGSLGINGVRVTPEILSAAPEPGSSGLFLSGGMLLCGISAAISRISKRHK
jgi:hypothetical protein